MTTPGYSGKSLVNKLGIKPGFTMGLLHQPDNYFDLLFDLPETARVVSDRNTKKDFIHYFTKDAEELERDLPLLKNEIVRNGMIWISWPKKTAKVTTVINENIIRNAALAIGLVDIKVCAVDEVWSALKLVIPVKDRTL